MRWLQNEHLQNMFENKLQVVLQSRECVMCVNMLAFVYEKIGEKSDIYHFVRTFAVEFNIVEVFC